MRIGRYEDRGRGGRRKGYVPEIKPRIIKHTPRSRPYGEKFRMEFDETHGILYCDLKLISGACGMMK